MRGSSTRYSASATREFRRYLEALLVPAERNKSLTALAIPKPIIGAQALRRFLPESPGGVVALNSRRLALRRAEPATAPDEGVLVIDEHGDRKWATRNGVVSVSTLWAVEEVYFPVDVEPYTPARHFESLQADPAFRTKLQLAVALAQRARDAGIPFRALVADAFYGKECTVRQGLGDLELGLRAGAAALIGLVAPGGQISGPQEAAGVGAARPLTRPASGARIRHL